MSKNERQPGEITVTRLDDRVLLVEMGDLEAVEIPEELAQALLDRAESEEERQLVREALAEQAFTAAQARRENS